MSTLTMTTDRITSTTDIFAPGFIQTRREKIAPPCPKYAAVEIVRKAVGFLVVASKHDVMAQKDDYEGACSTYPEASRLAAKLMKEMV